MGKIGCSHEQALNYVSVVSKMATLTSNQVKYINNRMDTQRSMDGSFKKNSEIFPEKRYLRRARLLLERSATQSWFTVLINSVSLFYKTAQLALVISHGHVDKMLA